MKRVRFAPSPTGSLHVGNALSAVINRREGDHLLLRIDDTDPTRNLPGGEEAILRDLEWLGIGWDEGPTRQSWRQERYGEAAEQLGGDRFGRTTLLREDGTATYHLASVVDDADFGITHVYRGNDHRPNEQLHRQLHEALGTTPPEYVHHGLILGEDGKKLSKRAEGATIESLRDLGLPPEAVRRYLDELGLPADTERLIGVVGRLWPQKRVKDLLWAAELLKTARDGCHVLIIGDGPQRWRLTRYRDQLRLADRAHFLGERADVARLMPHFDIFWLASGYEGQSNAVLEAMAAGVPVVATDIPGNRDLVVPEETGYLVPVGDRAEFARKSTWLFDDEPLRQRMGAAGRERIITHFTVEQMVARHAALYRQLL